MKKSELQQIIKEEINMAINEKFKNYMKLPFSCDRIVYNDITKNIEFIFKGKTVGELNLNIGKIYY